MLYEVASRRQAHFSCYPKETADYAQALHLPSKKGRSPELRPVVQLGVGQKPLDDDALTLTAISGTLVLRRGDLERAEHERRPGGVCADAPCLSPCRGNKARESMVGRLLKRYGITCRTETTCASSQGRDLRFLP